VAVRTCERVARLLIVPRRRDAVPSKCRDGAFQGTLSRTGDTTNFYDRAGRYQGYVTTRATAGFGWHNPFQEAVVKPQARATPRTSAFAQGLLR
jgi:hypothetical protein